VNFIGKARLLFSASFSEWYRAFINGEDSGQNTPFTIDREIALKYSAIFACTRVLSETLASMPLFTYRKQDDGSKKEGNDIGLYDILHYEPNYEMTPFNFKEALMMNLCLGGNGYAQKVFSSSRIPELLALYPQDYENVKPERDPATKRMTYKVRYDEGGISKDKTMTREYIFHIPGVSMNGITGIIPINYASKAIELGLTYETFGVNFYKNGANTSMALIHPKSLKDAAYERLKKEVEEKRTGLRNVNKPWLLEEGMQIKELTINPVDAQHLELKYFQIEEICRFYRVPLHLVQHLLRATNNNIEHQSLEFIIYTMLPWAKRIEENINLQLLTREERKAGYFTEFKFDIFLRGDMASRAAAYASARQWGWMSVNDIRRLENMNGIGLAGDIYLQPLNMGEAGKINQEDQQKAMTEAIYKMLENKGDEQNAKS
jgi:HK97 family phage portal protein